MIPLQRLGEKIRPHLFSWMAPCEKVFLCVVVSGGKVPLIGACCSVGTLETHIPLQWGGALNVLTQDGLLEIVPLGLEKIVRPG